jgi:catechol 2,3-dioxygenase-like lactoylglutathione lyase family enzyme
MKLSGLHHVSLCVTDEDEAVKFYTEVFGFEVLPRPDFGFGGYWLDTGRGQVHLIQADNVPQGGHHFAVQVEDIDAVVDMMRTKGVKVEPVPHMKGAGRQAFLHDPSGNLIELNEPDGITPG